MFGPTDLLALVVIVVLALLARRVSAPSLIATLERALASTWMPWVLGVASAVLMWWVWGSLNPAPVVHDEASYLLQARIYAAGHWVSPGRPLPEFFEQYHVFVTPVLTSKYPPGHPLLLMFGVWLGLPGVVPVALAGLTGALLFVLARRVTNVWVAIVAWFLWVTAPGVLEFVPSYMSEVTTGALWLLGWYALLRWMERDDPRWLMLVSFCIGFGFLARPLTMVGYAVPIAIVVLVRVARRRAWRELVPAIAIGAACLALFALWCDQTTGSPFITPYGLYSTVYFPDDVMGFGLSGHSARRALPPDMQVFTQWVQASHAAYTLHALPSQLWQRLVAIAENMWALRVAYLPIALLGLLTTSGAVWFAIGGVAALVLAYLSFGHGATWTVYYVEIQPVLAFITALGVWRLVALLAEGRAAWMRREWSVPSPRRALPMLASTVLLAPYLTRAIPVERDGKWEFGAYQRDFHTLISIAPGDRLIVFVRYAPGHSPHRSLITNDPDLARARAWIVYDRGPDDVRLMRLAPDRRPYLYDDAQHALVPMDTAGAPLYAQALKLPGAS